MLPALPMHGTARSISSLRKRLNLDPAQGISDAGPSELRWARVQDRTTPISGRDPSGPDGVRVGPRADIDPEGKTYPALNRSAYGWRWLTS
jgi:hypothetical protein